VESISPDMTPLTKCHDGFHSNYKNFIESQYRVKIEDVNQKLLKCKLGGIAVGRAEKDPIQLNYLLEKYNKEDEEPVYLAPELCYSVDLPAAFLIQLKLVPSFLHRLSRLLLVREILGECLEKTGWPAAAATDLNGSDSDCNYGTTIENELVLLTSAQESGKGT
jgi:hypothetical protein